MSTVLDNNDSHSSFLDINVSCKVEKIIGLSPQDSKKYSICQRFPTTVKCPIVTYFDVKLHPDLWDRSCTQTLRYFQSRPLGGQVQRTRPTENAQLSARW